VSSDRIQSQGGEADDRELVEKIRRGDVAAFEAIYRRYYHDLVRFTQSYVGSVEVADDLIGDVFLSVWSNRNRWDPKHGAKAYLFAAARNAALKHHRNTTRWNARLDAAADDDEIPGSASPPPPIDTKLATEERREVIRRALDALPPARRRAMILRWQDQMSFEEIAEVMGTTANAVQLQISRALKQLRQLLPTILK
jgi:RNA polymerase sigma-70 factor (ECF subfamily)